MAGPDLTPLTPPRPLPALPGPVQAAVVGDELHLVGGWSDALTAHVALDAAGDPAGEARTLPLAGVSSIAALGDLLMVAGAAVDRRSAVVLELDRDGRERGRIELPRPSPLIAWPQLCAAAGTAWAVWATRAAAGQPCLWLTRLDDPAHAVRLLEPWEPLMDLILVAAGDRLVAGLVHGAPAAAEAVLVEQEEAAERLRIDVDQPFSLSMAGASGSLIAACASRSGGDFHVWTLPGARARLRPPGRSRAHSIRLVSGHGGRLAALVQSAIRPGAPGRPESVRVVQYVGGHSALAGDPAGLGELDPPGVAYQAAGWVGARLLVVHGDVRPMVSVFAG